MATVQELYKEKLTTPEEAVKVVKDGDWVDYCQTCSFPTSLDRALGARAGELKDVKVRNAIAMKPIQVVEQDPNQESFTYNAWHCSPIDRKYIDEGKAFHIPQMFRNDGSFYTRGFAPVDVAMLTVSPMDRDGNFSYGLTNCCNQEIVDAAKIVIIEVNEQMPRVFGIYNDHINVKDVDMIVESSDTISTVKTAPPSEMDKQIAANIFPFLHDGMTLQLGIGGMPNALGTMIAESDLKDLGMHTELMSDGYLDLMRAGKITNKKKKLYPGKGLFAICNGSLDLYEYLDGSLDVLSAPVAYVNNPYTIKELDDFVSVNGCLQVDLTGQVNSESVGLRQISGTGGQVDFVTGTYMADNGVSILAMPSARLDKDGKVKSSSVVPHFNGEIVTTPRVQTCYVVTEQGAVNLAGRTVWERAEMLVSVAHPDCRDELIKEAEKLGYWRKSNKR